MKLRVNEEKSPIAFDRSKRGHHHRTKVRQRPSTLEGIEFFYFILALFFYFYLITPFSSS